MPDNEDAAVVLEHGGVRQGDAKQFTRSDRIRQRWLCIERRLSTKGVRWGAEIAVILAFFAFVLLPPLNLMITVVFNWSSVQQLIFDDPILHDSVWQGVLRSILLSFKVAIVVTIIDILIGVPIAHVLAHYDFPGKRIVDTIIDLPLVVPTSALGFSIFLFWGTNQGLSFLWNGETGLISQGPMLLVLGHVAFSFSYIVRNLKGVIEEVDPGVELAARTLGAPPVTIFRTISAPLAKEGIIAGAILAFTRSLGETGASLILAGVYQPASVQIVSFMDAMRIPETAFLALVMIIVSVSLLVGARQFARKVGLPQPRIYPLFERKISSKGVVNTRNSIAFSLFVSLVLIPSLFVIVYLATVFNGNPYSNDPHDGALYQIFDAPDNKWHALRLALTVSLEVAFLTTVINLVLGVPMAYLLVKRTYWGRWRTVLDALVDVPLVVPSSALGFSVFMLWGAQGLGWVNPGMGLILLAHLTFTYPFTVRPMISYIEGLDPAYQEAGRTLGASDLTTFRRVTLPMLKTGMLASAIMTASRSLSETGATIIVQDGKTRTVPVLIVDLVESEALPAAAFAAGLLVVISFLLLILIRLLDRDEEEASHDEIDDESHNGGEAPVSGHPEMRNSDPSPSEDKVKPKADPPEGV